MAENHMVSFSLVVLAAVFAVQVHGTDICSKADYGPLCRSVVKGASDPIAAMKTSIEHLMLETQRAKSTSTKLGKSQSMDVCKQNFDDAIYDLEKSLEYLKKNDKPGLKISLSAALTYYVTCDDAVAEGGIMQMAEGLLSTDTMLRHMASNCLYLSTLLK